MSYNQTIGVFSLRLTSGLVILESDVHHGFASVNITVLGLTNPDIDIKRMHQLYIDCSPGITMYYYFVKNFRMFKQPNFVNSLMYLVIFRQTVHVLQTL